MNHGKQIKLALKFNGLPALMAAEAAMNRCNLFHWAKRINKIPREHMKGGVLEQLLGGSHTQHVTNN
jgi:hypothetical protein